MDVLISGAGIGGLALAGGLARDGHGVRVLEAAPALRSGGAAVTIYSNGGAALHGLGAPLPAGLGGRIDRMEARDEHDRPIFRFDLTVLRARTGFPVVTVPRERLLRHLAAGLPDGAVTFDRAVESVEDGAVVDAAGTRHRADVIVGADGHRSAVRRAVLGGVPAREVGWTTWQGLSRVLPVLAAGHTARLYVGRAGLVGLMPAGDGLSQWWFDVTDPESDLRATFAHYPEPVRTLLASYADSDLGRFPHVAHEVTDVWGRGRVTLLGDAAHAFPPSQAQGANQALEDAWLLREALRGGDPTARLRAYERTRARRVRRVARMAVRETTNKPVGPLTRHLVSLVPAAIAGHAYHRLVRGFSSVLSGDRVA